MPSRIPRIAFYGGMANNCYMACKSMRAAGLDAVYVRDVLDSYAMSQPIWEDHRFVLSYQMALDSSNWTPEDWDRQADERGWRAPDWIIDPRELTEEAEPVFQAIWPVSLDNYTPSPADHYRRVLGFFQRCDLIFVSNVHAIILALLSGRPFVICPAGGEFLLATGQISGDGAVGETYLRQGFLLRQAFETCCGVLTNTAYLHHASLTGGLMNLLRHFPPYLFRRVSLPFTARPSLPGEARRSFINALLAELGAGRVETRFSVFVPSRVDFRWKGQDRLMQAIDQTPAADQFTFIFSGWGESHGLLQAWASGRPNIRIIGSALSKPLLYEFCQASDLVVDQFVLGHIGTAAREAACVGTPVMSWIQSGKWLPWARPEMPVLNASSAGDIADWLSRIAAGEVDLAREGDIARKWIETYASPALMRQALANIASDAAEAVS